jgi:hypothetical protein
MREIIDTDYDGMGNQGRLSPNWHKYNTQTKNKKYLIVSFIRNIFNYPSQTK